MSKKEKKIVKGRATNKHPHHKAAAKKPAAAPLAHLAGEAAAVAQAGTPPIAASIAGGKSHLPTVDADARRAVKHLAAAIAALPGQESGVQELIAKAKAAAAAL